MVVAVGTREPEGDAGGRRAHLRRLLRRANRQETQRQLHAYHSLSSLGGLAYTKAAMGSTAFFAGGGGSRLTVYEIHLRVAGVVSKTVRSHFVQNQQLILVISRTGRPTRVEAAKREAEGEMPSSRRSKPMIQRRLFPAAAAGVEAVSRFFPRRLLLTFVVR